MKKKIIPVLIAIVLIIVIGGIYMIPKVLEKYAYSEERADLNEYFQVYSVDDVSIMMENELISEKAKLIGGTLYFDYDTVVKYFVDRFYINEGENVLLYTTATEVIKVNMGDESNGYYVGDVFHSVDYKIALYSEDKLYIAIDYVKQYDNFSCELFESPNRIQVNTQWNTATVGDIKGNTQVRTLGGIKCPILQEVKEDEKVTILKQDETWSEIKTNQAIIGYVETKRLSNIREEEQIPVTEVAPLLFPSVTKEGTIALGWHHVMNQNANSNLAAVVEHTKGLTTISPTWFYLNDNDGNFLDIGSKDYVANAHSRGIEVWALIEDITYEVDLKEIMSSTVKRTNLINKLIQAVETYDLDGINIDFEGINRESGPHFIQFLRELSILTRAKGIVLSVDNYVPNEENIYYNRKEQGLVVDYVIIMGYDEHWPGGGTVGSVASINFVEKGITSTIEAGVPSDKIINAVPFYTRVWSTKDADITSSAVSMIDAEKWIAKNKIETVWDEETCQNYGEIQKDNSIYQVWLEDEKSLEVKLNIMKKHNVAGVAAWRLGYEKETAWELINNYILLE
ncbi:MAG TPA: glycosyl hydrolase family 18 protein [Lachnospiraceae bacterium]|nr:glycosyl hydrolase family 18 protein [Lachnospiraceae bacterium]